MNLAAAADIFLSYKSEDRARLAPIVLALKTQASDLVGARIGGGSDWRENRKEHSSRARCVIVAWSKVRSAPPAIRAREATRALRLGTYLPIQIDPVSPPLGFGEVQQLISPDGTAENGRSFRQLSGCRSEPGGGQAAGFRQSAIAAGALSREPDRERDRRSEERDCAGGGFLLLRPKLKLAGALPCSFSQPFDRPEQAYFSDGITEELRSALSRIGMEVIGRASSAAVKDMDARSAAAKLQVAHMLTGSVRRSPISSVSLRNWSMARMASSAGRRAMTAFPAMRSRSRSTSLPMSRRH